MLATRANLMTFYWINSMYIFTLYISLYKNTNHFMGFRGFRTPGLSNYYYVPVGFWSVSYHKAYNINGPVYEAGTL